MEEIELLKKYYLDVKVFDATPILKDFGPIMFGAAVCSPNGVQLFCAPSRDIHTECSKQFK
jgi:hypothetical protein